MRDRVTLTHHRDTGTQELIEPDGLEQLTVTIDLPDPYHS